MKHLARSLGIVLIALFSIGSANATPKKTKSSHRSEKRAEKLQDSLQEKQDRVEELSEEIQAIEEEISEIENASEDHVAFQEQTLNELNGRRDALTNEQYDLEIEIKELKKK